jgi:hypothetical protein
MSTLIAHLTMHLTAHRIPQPDDDPLPEKSPVPNDDDPAPHPDPVR